MPPVKIGSPLYSVTLMPPEGRPSFCRKWSMVIAGLDPSAGDGPIVTRSVPSIAVPIHKAPDESSTIVRVS